MAQLQEHCSSTQVLDTDLELTRINGFTLDSRSPASSMVTACNLQELGRDFDVITRVLDDLHSTLTGVIFRPRIAGKFVPLIARVSSFYIKVIEVSLIQTEVHTAQGLVVLRSKPHEASHERLRETRAQPKVQVRSVCPP